MSYNAIFYGDNRFSPSFYPAVLSTLSPYIDVSTGLTPSDPYIFRGTRFTTPSQPNYIDRFLLMEKGNAEIKQIYLGLENFASKYYFTPKGKYIRYYHYNAYMRVFINDNSGAGEIEIASMTCQGNSWSHWLSFQLDIANEKAVCLYWQLQNSDSEYGHASFFWGNTLSEEQKHCLYNLIFDAMIPPDPYENGGTSTTAGGGGDQTFASDAIGEPSAPTLSPQGSRLLTIYKVDSTKLASFANYLWAGGIDFATLHNIFNDTMGAIISLAVCPYTPDANTAQNLWFGNFDSGVSAHVVDSQYDTIDCGSVTLDEEYASCLDYNPYCRIELCLPYCGNVSLDPDEVMGTTISIKYKVDLLTGACLACVFADGNLLVTVAGNILATIPVTNADHKSIVSSITGTAISVVGAAAAVYTGGMSAPAGVAAASASTAANTLNMKERYNHGGTGNGNTALLGPQKPYLIIKWPRQCLPDKNGNYVGYPSMINDTLGNLTGFTKVYQIHLENIPCTADERAELESILKGGVII